MRPPTKGASKAKEQFAKWFEISYHALWNTIDDAMKPYRYTGRGSRMMGFAGPEDAVRWAEGELERIYEA